MNVDVTASPLQRKTTMLDLIAEVAQAPLDRGPAYNVKTLILHVGWHEGLELTKRKQLCGGPGRSFFQFEPPRAKDAIAYAKVKGWLGKLADSSGQTAADIEAGGNALPSTGSTWPEDNLIETLLSSDDHDLFATYLIRISLRKVFRVIPKGNDRQAEYWADHWRGDFQSADDRQEKIDQFVISAYCVDELTPPGHCLQQASNDNATKVALACAAKWEDNKHDCNKFLKAVAADVGIADIPDNYTTNQLIHFLDGSPTGWIKLLRGDHQGAFDKARDGWFVVAGLTSDDMDQDHGHVAVITSGDMVHSGSDNIDYPRGYWGMLNGQGGQCKGMNHAFPPPRKQLRYFCKSLG